MSPLITIFCVILHEIMCIVPEMPCHGRVVSYIILLTRSWETLAGKLGGYLSKQKTGQRTHHGLLTGHSLKDGWLGDASFPSATLLLFTRGVFFIFHCPLELTLCPSIETARIEGETPRGCLVLIPVRLAHPQMMRCSLSHYGATPTN